ncbi:16S rRNA (cytidine(1402)-2'-O)-methyltransferase [Alkalicella caledoniensis]|uniref:Ribosomal RNA small subunit methyltransferase I n=1 Tax=Alkalicella caledoniensis TaxID=2731377 RepID=A0A7G9W888_ALKCA|nr:16S rRNA (cytidine(1402)-2'-O)-methyltransferase [Alkalicella caledoniensis]QNO14900.1 16S rRNA (cytidine(1402)-2'-O)-methyltransferase [Alkalicella caledoniensis]
MAGKLYLCATPIGNLEDMSLRAINTLKGVDFIAAEDTRRTGMLLKHFSIESKLIQYHKFNERKQVDNIIELLDQGKDVALVSDAGTPGISDPGEILVRAVNGKGHKVVPIPGPCALICALTISGLDTSEFKFIGFMPKGNSKKPVLEKAMSEHCTVVFYQSPHDLLSTLEQIEKIDNQRKVVAVREITKIYEEKIAGNAKELISHFNERGIKGEFTILIEAKEEEIHTISQGIVLVEELLEQGQFLKEACKNAAKELNLGQRDLYQFMINKGKK